MKEAVLTVGMEALQKLETWVIIHGDWSIHCHYWIFHPTTTEINTWLMKKHCPSRIPTSSLLSSWLHQTFLTLKVTMHVLWIWCVFSVGIFWLSSASSSSTQRLLECFVLNTGSSLTTQWDQSTFYSIESVAVKTLPWDCLVSSYSIPHKYANLLEWQNGLWRVQLSLR